MFKLRLKNYLTQAMGVHLDQEKYDNITINKIVEQVFLGIAEGVYDEFIEDLAEMLEEKAVRERLSYQGNSWISPYLKEFQEEVSRIFEKYAVENNMIEGSSTKPILLTILKLFGIPIEEKDIFLFDRMVENRFRHKAKDKQVKYLSLTYSQLLALIEEWCLKDVMKQFDFRSHLENTISQYSSLLDQCECDVLSSPLRELIENLQSKLKAKSLIMTHRPTRSQGVITENTFRATKEIFNFYAQQLKMLGKSPTFDEITDHKNILNISKFTKFCSDFDVTSKHNKDCISVQQATQAFLTGNDCSRSMTYEQFVISLEALADLYYDEQYDSRNNTNYARLQPTEKTEMFYKFLRLDNRSKYLQKAKGFGVPFSKDKAGSQLQDNHLSNKYMFKDTTQKKQKIDERKNNKEEISGSVKKSSPINPARLSPVKKGLVQRKESITWDILKTSQQFALISKDDLSNLFTDDDIKEIISANKLSYK